MPSSTSHFRALIPWAAVRLLAVAAITWAAAAAYTVFLNPEIALFRGAAMIKQNWARRMTQEHGPKTVIYGGSSCAFSIDGEHLLQHDLLPAVNMGLHAGMGSLVLTRWALSEVRPGDTLIVALEPFLLTDPQDPATFDLGIQFSSAMRQPGWARAPYGVTPALPWLTTALALRPGGYHFFTILGKVMARRPLYRYQLSDFHPSGWQQTTARYSVDDSAPHGTQLSNHTIQLFRWLTEWCAQNKVRVAYSLPWSYAPPEKVPELTKENLELLLEIGKYLPILKDEALGFDTDRSHFSDSPLHLIGDAAAVRSDALARGVKDWKIWKEEELAGLLAKLTSKPTP